MKKHSRLEKLVPQPATQLFVWICVAIVVQKLHAIPLLVVTISLLLVAYTLHDQRLFKLIRRTRWILLSLFIIYAFLTPGTELWSGLNLPSPSIEGVSDGLMQLGRLMSVLASLSILLTLLSTEQMLGGIYRLTRFVRYIGISPEKMAVRLALTLHYAEDAMRNTAEDWQNAIQQALTQKESGSTNIEINTHQRRWIDVVFLVLSGALLFGAWK